VTAIAGPGPRNEQAVSQPGAICGGGDRSSGLTRIDQPAGSMAIRAIEVYSDPSAEPFRIRAERGQIDGWNVPNLSGAVDRCVQNLGRPLHEVRFDQLTPNVWLTWEPNRPRPSTGLNGVAVLAAVQYREQCLAKDIAP
jgi:hypothetical protein